MPQNTAHSSSVAPQRTHAQSALSILQKTGQDFRTPRAAQRTHPALDQTYYAAEQPRQRSQVAARAKPSKRCASDTNRARTEQKRRQRGHPEARRRKPPQHQPRKTINNWKRVHGHEHMIDGPLAWRNHRTPTGSK